MFNKLKWYYQRATRGFSDYDAGDFFTYEANIISNLADYYLKLHFGHPCGIKINGEWGLKEIELKRGGTAWVCDCDCEAEWDRILTVIRDGYRLIADGEDEEDDYVTLLPVVKEAQDLYHEYWRSLWL